MGQSTANTASKKTITVIIIAKNEETMIVNCLATVRFADEVIVVDTGSTDNTKEIADREGANVIVSPQGSFADFRNAGLREATGDWILYIDADERVTPKLFAEIDRSIQFTSFSAFSLSRNNIHFGAWMQHGGWQKDRLVRLFKRSDIKHWEGNVHEHAVISGEVGQLKEPLVHLTHRNLMDGLVKSTTWTNMEAELLVAAGVKKVNPFTLVRKTLMEFFRRLLFKRGYKDGMEGWIESFQQAINRFFVYERVWELQQKPSLSEKYERIEREIVKLWEKESRS